MFDRGRALSFFLGMRVLKPKKKALMTIPL
jgi:hypothetical protein